MVIEFHECIDFPCKRSGIHTAPAPDPNRPVSKEFIKELKLCGASPELIKLLEDDRKSKVSDGEEESGKDGD